MKFLFDQSADFRLIPYLQGLGHDVLAISRDYPHGLSDEHVLSLARQERRILVVADRDFGELIVQRGRAHAGVIYFRLPGAPLATKVSRLQAVLLDHERDLQEAEFLVVTHAQIRVARGRS